MGGLVEGPEEAEPDGMPDSRLDVVEPERETEGVPEREPLGAGF